MKHKIVIYTSIHLRTTPKTVCIANAISKALGDLGIEHRELSNTNDYWCRDYMPVLLSGDGVYAKYKYNPNPDARESASGLSWHCIVMFL